MCSTGATAWTARSGGPGGSARVFLGTDLGPLGRQVAIKVLNPELTEDLTFVTRFEEEARRVAALEHPHILTAYDYGHVADTAYLVMPFIAGGTLQDRLSNDRRLPLAEVSAYLRQAAAALDYAHARGIVHRDVKPQNMLIRDDGHLFLADFGIAKVLQDTRAASSSTVIGTLAYMAPEQFQGQESPASDVYALGCVAFQLLTGEVPYTGPTQQVMHGHLMAPVPSVTERSQGLVSPALQGVMDRALAKEPRERFGTAGELAAALQAVAEGRTVTPPWPQPGPGDDATRPVMRPAAEATMRDDPRRRAGAATASRGGARRWFLPVGALLAVLLLAVGAVAALNGARSGTATSTATVTVTPVVAYVAPTVAPLAVAPAPTAAPTSVPVATAVPSTATPIPPTATPVPPSPTPRPPTATPVPPTATVVPVAAMRWTGEIRLGGTGEVGRDLDQVPPGDAGSQQKNDLYGNNVNYQGIILSGGADAARWTGAAPPTAAQCADAIARLGVGTNYTFRDPEKGLAFCLKTGEGRVAFLTVTDVGSGGFFFSVTVWEKASPR